MDQSCKHNNQETMEKLGGDEGWYWKDCRQELA